MTKKIHIPTGINMIAFTALMTAGMTSCEYKELEEGSALTPVTIHFDWQENLDSVPDAIPGSMRVAFYPVNDLARANMNKGYTFFDLPQSIWDATVQLPAGIYDVVAWNNDTEHVLTDKYGSQKTLHATTPPYNSRGTFDTPTVLDSIYNGQRVLDYPDYMVHAINTEEEIFYGAKNQMITLSPDSMVVTIEYKIHGIGGLSWVKQARGAVNNVAGKRFMAYDNLTEDAVAVMFDCNYNAEDGLLYGKFYVFGIEPTEMSNLTHKMVFFFWMDAGKVYLPLDVTKIFAAYRRDQSKIVIDIPSLNIDLRDYVTSKNTFDIDLDDWDNVNIDIGF